MDYLHGAIEQLKQVASLLSVAILFLIASIAGWRVGKAEDKNGDHAKASD